MRDVVVIGAGPAGSVTAAALAEQGHDVVLLEEHAEAGLPVHCTGLLGEEAFEEFELPRQLILARAGAARFWGTAGDSFSVGSSQVRAAIIDRAGLDRLLAERAEQAGATVLRSWRAESIDVTAHGVTVTARERSPIEARACVLACGANYRFHRMLDLGRPAVFLQSAQLETPFPQMPGIEVQFGRDVAPGGFAWLVPFDKAGAPHARIGLMGESHANGRFDAFVKSLQARAGDSSSPLAAPRLKVLPLAPIAKTYADRILAVGDAAGLVKPTTGGGIYYGMRSGRIAAEVLDQALCRDRLDNAALRKYESGWQSLLGREIKMGLAFRKIAARLNDESIDALIALGRSNGVVPILQRTASFNWHRKAAMALLGHPAFRKIVFGKVLNSEPVK